jgi:hypothetical protein
MMSLIMSLLTRKTLSNGGEIVGVPKFDDQGRLLVAGGAVGPAGADGAAGAGVVDFSTTETATNVKWIDGKTVYVKVIDFGAIPDTSTKSVAHGLAAGFQIIEMSFMIRRSTDNDHRHVPYVSLNSASDASMNIDGTNVNIDTESAWTNFTGVVILWYTKA